MLKQFFFSSKIYYFFFGVFVFTVLDYTIFINEEILLFVALVGMFYTVYLVLSPFLWDLIDSEIESIRSHFFDVYFDQLEICYDSIELILKARKILYIRFYFCFWSYIMNKFAYAIAGTKCFNQSNKFYTIALRSLYKICLKQHVQICKMKIKSFQKFITLFSFFAASQNTDVIRVKYNFTRLINRYQRVLYFICDKVTEVEMFKPPIPEIEIYPTYQDAIREREPTPADPEFWYGVMRELEPGVCKHRMKRPFDSYEFHRLELAISDLELAFLERCNIIVSRKKKTLETQKIFNWIYCASQ